MLSILDDWKGRPEKEEHFPEHWQEDSLALMGQYLDWIDLDEHEKRHYRTSTMEMVDRNGALRVLENRMRLAAEMEFLQNF